ncbi:MAG TPA: NADH-quinone oxidoreductase subunit I [Myxococcaceae bacterium]|nr:NADH-quinone oxidoreductase subunit I [Myxococcaceae bacterium]
MGYFTDGLRALGVTLTNILRPAATVEYPKVIRPRAERYRSSFALLHDADGDEACIGCLQCERICPSQVIAIKFGGKRESPITGKKRGYADDFVLDMSACIFCELCVQVCPTDAIVMTREPDVPGYRREDLVLTMDRLYANEKSKPRSWGDATRLMEMQEPPRPPKPAPAPAPASAPAGAASPAPAPASAPAAAASPAPAAAAAPPAPPTPGPAAAAAAVATPTAAPAPAASSAQPPSGSTGEGTGG